MAHAKEMRKDVLGASIIPIRQKTWTFGTGNHQHMYTVDMIAFVNVQ